jgi:hypothetical protein
MQTSHCVGAKETLANCESEITGALLCSAGEWSTQQVVGLAVAYSNTRLQVSPGSAWGDQWQADRAVNGLSAGEPGIILSLIVKEFSYCVGIDVASNFIIIRES